MSYNIGNFITTNKSYYPALIISKNETANSFLVSIIEYMGDYMWIYLNEIIGLADINSEQKLSIVANFGDWFYKSHKLIYQELIIENLGA